MKVKHIVTLKIVIEDPQQCATATASEIEDAMNGEFGKRMWKLGTFADAYVTKVKEKGNG